MKSYLFLLLMLLSATILFAQDKVDVVNSSKDLIYVEVEQSPEYTGGIKAMYEFMGSKMKYPEKAKKEGVEGRVILQFVVDKDGTITDVVVVKSVDKLLDAEAVRVVKLMPRWKPGKIANKAVRVKYTLPIRFKI